MSSVCSHVTSSNLASSVQNQLVYKEECTKCFDNQDFPAGLDVCLKCFNGACAGENQHNVQHFQQTNHAIVLNIKRTKIEVAQDEPPQKITKLAIGVEGGADVNTDLYEYDTTVKCLACATVLDKTSPELSSLVDSVMLASSASMQESTKEWEAQRFPCEHTLTLQQQNNAAIAQKSLAHCGQCELSSNLWLCLVCGDLGCGRKYADGTGGNNHAVGHFEQTQHPLVCKLGTITADGTADVYCYACNDEVIDESIGSHLAHFGIDIAGLSKTEKTIAEMELEQNLKLDFSQSMDGKKATPLFGAGYTGLQNLGNSCYMASILQVLFSVPEIQQRYKAMAMIHLATCAEPAATCFACQICKLADGLLSGRYSTQKHPEDMEQTGVRPQMFKALVGRNHPEFSTNRMQDALEFFHYLLDFVQQRERVLSSIVDSPEPSRLFGFKLQQRTQCQNCSGVSYKNLPASEVTLPIPNHYHVAPPPSVEQQASNAAKTEQVVAAAPVPLSVCFDQFGSEEVVDYNCTHCRMPTKALKSFRFSSFPDMLVLQIQRFVYDQWVPRKLDLKIVAPTHIDLTHMRATGPDASEFLLADEPESGSVQFVPNAELLPTLESMGFPRVQCERALYETGNTDSNAAVTWLFSNQDNPDINVPVPTGKSSSAGSNEPPADLIAQLTSMGFSEAKAKRALRETSNNMERAVDWVFSHMDEPDDELTAAAASSVAMQVDEPVDNRPPRFQLHAVVTHLGSSVHSGHYVAHVLQEDKWVLFNDNKVALTAEPPQAGYIYFYRRIGS
eukprot:GILK01001820.1.p1 GENE.GILK01001820.1~~GILK01001820.1.p1  ORF type:complete len:787 (-),score=161.23 GILK01001820.1:112-2472(-)